MSRIVRRAPIVLLIATMLVLSMPTAVAQTPVPGDGTGGAPPCRVRSGGALPDPTCTPGSILTQDIGTVCQSGYAASVRNVPESEKAAVYAEYGITDHTGYVVDHLIGLAVGGSNEITNLWPMRTDTWPGGREKDLIEGALYRAVCADKVSIADAQRWEATDWRIAFLEGQ